MPDEAVLDASIAIKMFLDEPGSLEVRALAASGARFAAPELVLVEVAHVLLKRARRREVSRPFAEAMLPRVRTLFDELVRIERLAGRAFSIAADYGMSAYDALYVTLAESREWPLATSDFRLIERLEQSGLPIRIWTP